MRIIGGNYRGKKLFTPTNLEVRPTAERAREALFSIIYARFGSIENYKVLDVFAGTGAFGLEAISRGAKSATFIDINPTLAQKNIKLFPKEQDKFSIIKTSALKLPFARQSYNLLFMDAPYTKGLTEPALTEIINKNWLEDQALCIIETERNEKLETTKNLELIDERVYGVAKIRFYIYKKEKI